MFLTFDAIHCTFINHCEQSSFCAKMSDKLGFRIRDRGSVGVLVSVWVRVSYCGVDRLVHFLVSDTLVQLVLNLCTRGCVVVAADAC